MANKKEEMLAPLRQKYATARIDLIFLIALTVLNIVMVFVSPDRYFLFSASLPYSLVLEGAVLCGLLPPEYYEGLGIYEYVDISYMITVSVIAAIVIIAYIVFWIFSKKKVGFLIAAACLFAADTVYMLWYFGISGSSLFDILLHGLVLYYFINGIIAHYKMKKIEAMDIPEEPQVTGYGTEDENVGFAPISESGEASDSTGRGYNEETAAGYVTDDNGNAETTSSDVDAVRNAQDNFDSAFDYSDRDSYNGTDNTDA
jgi:hypothetical protein